MDSVYCNCKYNKLTKFPAADPSLIMQKATRQQLKAQNRDLVLKILFESSRISRADIARMTGLTRTTVSELVAEFINEGLVSEVGMGVSIGGKSPILLSVAGDSRYMIALDLANNEFRGAIVDLRGQIREMVCLPVNGYNGERALEATFAIIDQLVKLPYSPFMGIAAGTPGLVNSHEGVVVYAANLEWQNLPLRQILHERYGMPVIIQNDCQAAAMGEFIFGGTPPASRNMIVVRAGYGIAAGVIIDGAIFQGDGGFAGEIGHAVVVREDGLECRCGKFGCLETLASARAVVRRADLMVENGSLPAMLAKGQPVTLDLMVEAYQAGDALIGQIINQAGYYLGLSISGLVSTLNIQQIILMGEMTRFGAPWLDVVREAMNATTLTRLGQETTIQIGALRDNDVILGASALLAGNYSLLFK